MIVLSLKASTLKVTAALAALAIVIAAACWEGGVAKTATGSIREVTAASKAVDSGLAAKDKDVSTNALRVAFLKKLGWNAVSEPAEVAEVVIPQKFNAVFNRYNAIQKEQGYDLTQYRGVRAKRWTYTITNYPGVKEGVRANLLVYNGKLIGGDVSSVALNGFMQSLTVKNVKTGITPAQADIVAETFKSNAGTVSN